MTERHRIREAEDSDGDTLRSILAAVFAEYPGCLFVREELPELEQPQTWFREHGGVLWVLERDGVVKGCIGTAPESNGVWELKKLYLLSDMRGLGLGRTLIEQVETHARSNGATRIHLWTDTRFETAHRVYERCGYTKLPETRDLHDASASIEFHYEKWMRD